MKDHKILKVEYLSNPWSSLLQILNLSSENQTKIKKFEKNMTSKKRPPLEDDFELLKIEYLSNQWPDLPQIWNLSSWDQTKINNA